ncbi:MAG: STAS domain-containing protein [Clostridiales bacterium]|nr:STAS domain-containing protein [Clostridiales bacterium]
MTVNTIKNAGAITIEISGRIDTTTAPQLEKEVNDNIAGVSELIFDFKDVAYISSAGLRVLLTAQKVMNQQGKMKIVNVSKDIMEIFDITGFADIMDIQRS